MSRLKGLDPARLNHRVTVMRYQEAEDELGNTVNALSPLKTIWAEIKTLRGQELTERYKNINTTVYKVTIRANAVKDINTKDVLVYNDRQLQINTLSDARQDGYYLELQCTESADHTVKEADDDGGTD